MKHRRSAIGWLHHCTAAPVEDRRRHWHLLRLTLYWLLANRRFGFGFWHYRLLRSYAIDSLAKRLPLSGHGLFLKFSLMASLPERAFCIGKLATSVFDLRAQAGHFGGCRTTLLFKIGFAPLYVSLYGFDVAGPVVSGS